MLNTIQIWIINHFLLILYDPLVVVPRVPLPGLVCRNGLLVGGPPCKNLQVNQGLLIETCVCTSIDIDINYTVPTFTT